MATLPTQNHLNDIAYLFSLKSTLKAKDFEEELEKFLTTNPDIPLLIDSLCALVLARHHTQIEPAICSGDPTLKGTRIRMEHLAKHVQNDREDAQKSFPHLTNNQIEAALWYTISLKLIQMSQQQQFQAPPQSE